MRNLPNRLALLALFAVGFIGLSLMAQEVGTPNQGPAVVQQGQAVELFEFYEVRDGEPIERRTLLEAMRDGDATVVSIGRFPSFDEVPAIKPATSCRGGWQYAYSYWQSNGCLIDVFTCSDPDAFSPQAFSLACCRPNCAGY